MSPAVLLVTGAAFFLCQLAAGSAGALGLPLATAQWLSGLGLAAGAATLVRGQGWPQGRAGARGGRVRREGVRVCGCGWCWMAEGG